MLKFRKSFSLAGLPMPFTKLVFMNFPVQLKFSSFTIPCIVLTSFYTDDETSCLRNTELHPKWTAPSGLRY